MTNQLITDIDRSETRGPDHHDWEIAGEAWGRHSHDWACLFEHYAIDTIMTIHRRLAVDDGTTLLDVACGSGLAIRLAESAGATTAGLDAAASLVDIARARNPRSDLRVGTMFDLPWSAESFDVVTSINGVWGDCGPALTEANRVLRPGGGIGISFWGDSGPFDLRDCFIAFAVNSPPDHLEGMLRTNDISRPGVAEQMLTDAGFVDLRRDSRVSVLEWPDADVAWRAISSIGPAVPALEHVGADALRPQVLEALERCRDVDGIYRLRSTQQFITATKPG